MNIINNKTIILISTLCIAASCSKKNNLSPNVLIILLDDAGYNDFGFMGSSDIFTPNIDALAADGVILTDAHVTASVSGPSRAGILTGRYQQKIGYECNLEEPFGLDTIATTLGDVFKNAGYNTYAVGKWHQGNSESHHPNKRGFSHFYGFTGGARSYFPEKHDSLPEITERSLQYNGNKIIPKKYLTYEIGEKAEEFIKQNGDNPFMMYLAFNAVHTPMHATQEDLVRFEGHPRQKLAAMSYAVDKAIGGVISTLKDINAYENTLIFFLSDNGGAHDNESCNYPLKGFKGNKFEGGIRVPYFITFGENLPQGHKYDKLCSSLDIFATSTAVANIPTQNLNLDGTNLLPFITGTTHKAPHEVLFWRKNHVKAIRDDNYKLIELENKDYRLYDLSKNLEENEDLSLKNPQQLKAMKYKLEIWESDLVNPVLWNEKEWEPVNIEIHKMLMNNETCDVFTPNMYKHKYLKKNSEF